MEDINNLIVSGENVYFSNSFYKTLGMLIKYYFLINRSDINLMDLMRDVSKSELEFKTFMVYKNFAVDLYYSHVQDLLSKNSSLDMSYDDIIYIILHYVKTEYDKDHKVLSAYITGLDNEEMIEKFNYIKTTYELRKEEYSKVSKLFEAIKLLEEAKDYENKATSCRDKALKILYDVHKSSKILLQISDISTSSSSLIKM